MTETNIHQPALKGCTNQHKNNSVLNDDNCPTIRLCRGLTKLVGKTYPLTIAAATARKYVTLLDDSPRHDAVVCDEILGQLTYRYGLASAHKAQKRLEHCLGELDQAISAIAGTYRGDDKAKFFDRLCRHRAEALSLSVLFGNSSASSKTQVFAWRQQICAQIYHSLSDVLELISPLRKSLIDEPLPDGVFMELDELEDQLFRMRSSVARWRDNPSQRMAAKMTECERQVLSIHCALEQMKQNSQYECQNPGMQFYIRQGIAVVIDEARGQ